MNETANEPAPAKGWLNRTVWGTGLTSLLADLCYETVTSVLPQFLILLNVPPTVFAVIEGAADAASNFVKLGAGWWSDRLGRRKPMVVLGYAINGGVSLLFALAAGWPLILTGRVLGWIGKGLRGPLRNAILAEAVPKEHRGKAFGFHRAGDTIGAILGPLMAWLVLRSWPASITDDPTRVYRFIFLLTLIPGIGSALAFAFLVREKPHIGDPARKMWASLKALPAPFRRWLIGVGVFGLGDFSHSLLILAAVTLLSPQMGEQSARNIGPLLYVIHNIAHAITAFSVGALSDRIGRMGLLRLGYALGVCVMVGFALAFHFQANWIMLAALFALGGIYLATEETLENAAAADLVPDTSLRGTAFGLLGTVNGLGDFLSSSAFGLLWLYSPIAGFLYAAVMMSLGTILLRSGVENAESGSWRAANSS